ncbi:Carnitine O-acetyltransferase mitochondrial [Maublancomyces gigas]|uniref:Carnitine O-acetyltransferase mitochondrial n=1 Tax=Discina gigas TaxID=1032678 RepID=A0ABR3GQD2_9PEZI
MAPVVTRTNASLAAGYKEDNSKGPMLRFQESLPRLVVPTLQETADRYIKSVHPLISASELEATESAVTEFLKPGGVGEALQNKLLARAADPNVKNWIIEWWNESAYLGYRDPVVPYVSYFYSYKDDKKRRDPAKRAAAITTAALEFKKMVDGGTLEPEYMRKQPMCMDSYKWMFNACRIPKKPVDEPIKYPASEHKYFVVIRKNHFFKVFHEVDGTQLNTHELEAQFARIYELANLSKAPAIGALTSENRDVWTDARQTLLDAAPENATALTTIESASFVFCLDDTSPVTLEERAHQYWHGDGQNRFFDKPIQFIVNENGTAGFMGEHSMMDGTPTHRLNDYINESIFKNKLDFSSGSVRSNLPEPTPVRFTVNDAVHATIDQAQRDFRNVVGLHDLRVLAFQGYGKGLIKKFKCSPDAYVQMIIQLAYFKMYGKNRPTYESTATRRFQLGRTETCRTVSDESVAWCNAMSDPDIAPQACIGLFRKAIDAHVKYITDASDGRGVDRHLFGLKRLLEPGQEQPSLFKDPAYAYSTSWFLSTSQLSSDHFNGYGWSQVIDGGFGIAYMINESNLQFNIASKKLGADKMQFYLTDAANDMRELMESEMEIAKAKL